MLPAPQPRVCPHGPPGYLRAPSWKGQIPECHPPRWCMAVARSGLAHCHSPQAWGLVPFVNPPVSLTIVSHTQYVCQATHHSRTWKTISCKPLKSEVKKSLSRKNPLGVTRGTTYQWSEACRRKNSWVNFLPMIYTWTLLGFLIHVEVTVMIILSDGFSSSSFQTGRKKITYKCIKTELRLPFLIASLRRRRK